MAYTARPLPAQTMILAKIPSRLTHSECSQFLTERIVTPIAKNQPGDVVLDFSKVAFIDPSGVASLNTALQFLYDKSRDVHFVGHDVRTEANVYLDDSGLFSEYLATRVFEDRPRRQTTVPLHLFGIKNYYGHLMSELMPWIAGSVDMDAESLEVLRTTLEEAYHNVTYHSGVNCGCVFAQHFPRREQLEVVISDHGYGIPVRVRGKFPNTSDTEALQMAFRKGFTTGSVVANRGWGLWQLSNYAAQKNGGFITVRSGHGLAVAATGHTQPVISTLNSRWLYPGTLVRIVLKTDKLRRLRNDTEKEVFSW